MCVCRAISASGARPRRRSAHRVARQRLVRVRAITTRERQVAARRPRARRQRQEVRADTERLHVSAAHQPSERRRLRHLHARDARRQQLGQPACRGCAPTSQPSRCCVCSAAFAAQEDSSRAILAYHSFMLFMYLKTQIINYIFDIFKKFY